MNYMVEGFESEGLAELIDNAPAKRLIQELNFKYGMKVLSAKVANNLGYAKTEFYLTESTGAFVVARVWTHKEDGLDVYNYRSPFYRKDRGSDTADRETIYSKKLSTLMSTLKRQNVVPSLDGLLKSRHEDAFRSGVHALHNHYGRLHKNHDLDTEDVHDLLRAVVGETPDTLDKNKCKELLDKFNEVDKIKAKRDQDIARFFDNEFYAVGADGFGDLVIGTLKKNDAHKKFDVIKPFKRVKDLSNHEEIQPIMLMNKVIAESNDAKLYGGYVISANSYLPDLDIVNACIRRVDEFDLTWMFIPCSKS